ncbi:hypothetical protein NKG99_27885 [Mesorhizobium sp. M1409]|uniref:helix-turn-helix domain-containing protein n=1 Tax=unclassified Mesorhizobium TaxID=325217 RepID=UPI003336FEC9
MWSASTIGPRKGHRYGTIICDLGATASSICCRIETPTRSHHGWNAILASRSSRAIVPAFMPRAPHRGAPDATQAADRWHLLQNLGEALRLAVGCHRKAVSAAGKAMIAEMAGIDDARQEPSEETSTKLDGLRRSRRNQRRELYAEIFDLRTAGLSPRQIAPRIGISVRTVERWLAAGGKPEHRRPSTRSVLDSFQDYLEQRWQQGQRNGLSCGPKSSAAALKAAGGPSTDGPPPARSGHRPLHQIHGGGRHRAGTVHGS